MLLVITLEWSVMPNACSLRILPVGYSLALAAICSAGCVDLTPPWANAVPVADASLAGVTGVTGAAGGSSGAMTSPPSSDAAGYGGDTGGGSADAPTLTSAGGESDGGGAAGRDGASADAALDYPLPNGAGGSGGSAQDAPGDIAPRGGGGAGAASGTGGSAGDAATGSSGGTGGAGGGAGADSGAGGADSGAGGASDGGSPHDAGACTGYVGENANLDAGLTQGLVAYYTCDQTAGPSLLDQSGNGHNGTIVSGTGGSAGYSFAPGKVSNALDFSTGNKGCYVTLPAGLLATACEATLATWVYLNSEQNWQRIFDFGQSQDVYMFLTTQASDNGQKVRFAISLTGNTHEQQLDGLAAIPINAWHHVAVVLGPSGGFLYLDGTQVGSNTTMTYRPADIGAQPNCYIGKSEFSDPYLDGDIQEFRVYDRALSSSEVAALWSGL